MDNILDQDFTEHSKVTVTYGEELCRSAGEDRCGGGMWSKVWRRGEKEGGGRGWGGGV